jgi:hypothetical protein
VYRVRGATGPAPDRILLGGPDGFIVDTTFPEDRGRTSGAVFADLDGDGDDDLVAARNQRGDGGIRGRPSVVYENTGDGWRERSTIAPNNGARSVAAVDVDRDGFLDLVIASDRFGDGSTIALRGDGAFGFEESTVAWGIPTDLTGLALATVDVDSDGWLDVVVNGDARVLLGGDGGFEVTEVPELEWATFGNEDDPAGVAVGDLDGDSRPDLVLGHHFNSTVDSGERVPVRILLNRSDSSGVSFEDITDESGSPALWTKSPHVAIVDVDNDGANDIVTSAAAATGEPVVLRQLPTGAGEVRFETIGQEGSGEYYVTGVSDDFDRDGRVDSLLLAWEPERPSILADNRSASSDWLEVDPGSSDVGLVEVIDPATGTVLARAWTQSTTGYAAGASEIVHFGLGDAPSEVVIRLGGADAATSDPVPINAAVSAIGC